PRPIAFFRSVPAAMASPILEKPSETHRDREGPMDPTQAELYGKIREFDIDDGPVAQPFVIRLARENGWSEVYAARVLAEYKKSVFRALAAGHPVPPSEQIDQAWHLHLCYPRSYWERFCNQVLGRPLHHHPTRGGEDEARKHIEQYRQTLASYR